MIYCFDESQVWSCRSPRAPSACNLRAIWAVPGGTLYTVGQGGLILHYRP